PTTTKAAPTAPAAPAAPTDFSSTVVDQHNYHRLNHSAGAVSWDSGLASYAQTVASSCHYAHDLTPGGGGYGQNIAAYGASDSSSLDSSTAAAAAITNMWYNDEINNFPYGQDSPTWPDSMTPPGPDWSHASQLIWVGTQKVGCAAVLCPSGTIFGMDTWFTVCNYEPAGNVYPEFASNVKPPLGQKGVSVNI
ncbi:hypothetical protein B7463_g8302, partial [Scytalidium lignicola]